MALDPTKPEWQFVIIRNNADNNHNAFLIRFNHAVSDGLRISQFFEKWMKFEDGTDG